MKHFGCYDFITEQRQKALDLIKEQNDILEKRLYMEKMLEKNIFC
jgi:hypothetical protein